MCISFKNNFIPKQLSDGKKEVSKKVILGVFYKRWKISYLVAWGERYAISRAHNQSPTRPSKQDPSKASSPLHVLGLRIFSELEGVELKDNLSLACPTDVERSIFSFNFLFVYL